DLPLMNDPELLAAMEVLSVLMTPAYFHDFRLAGLHICRMLNGSLQHGASGASVSAFALWMSGPGWIFHRYDEAYRFAKLACDLVEKHGFIAGQAKVYGSTGTVAVWTQSIATAIDFNRKSFRAAMETGELTYASFARLRCIPLLLLRNDPLDPVWRASEY